MRVAAGAIRRGAHKSTHRLRHQIVAIQILKALRRCPGRALVVRPRAQKTECHRERRVFRIKRIGCQLRANEFVPPRVVIQTADHVIAKPPRVRPHHVVLEAMRIREVNRVQPMPRPAFTIVRRCEQPVDQFRPRLSRQFFQVLHCWRQAVQIEEHAPHQGARICLRRRFQSFFGEFGFDKRINRVFPRRRHGHRLQALQRPPFVRFRGILGVFRLCSRDCSRQKTANQRALSTLRHKSIACQTPPVGSIQQNASIEFEPRDNVSFIGKCVVSGRCDSGVLARLVWLFCWRVPQGTPFPSATTSWR